MFGKRILILIPHPDDEVVGCCGGILRALAQGSKILGGYLTTGISSKPKQKKMVRRRQEATEAACHLNIHPLFFEETPSRCLKDKFSDVQNKIIVAIKTNAIDTIWTPAYEGGHQDHDVANFMANRLKPLADIWEFSEYNFFGNKRRSNSFFKKSGNEIRIELNAEERAIKKKALSIYRSEWFNLWVVKPNLVQETYRPLAAYDYTQPPHEGKCFTSAFRNFHFTPKLIPSTPATSAPFFNIIRRKISSNKNLANLF